MFMTWYNAYTVKGLPVGKDILLSETEKLSKWFEEENEAQNKTLLPIYLCMPRNRPSCVIKKKVRGSIS